MKYGIWTLYEEAWCSPNIGGSYYANYKSNNRFISSDLNIAYQYKDQIEKCRINFPNHKYEVREFDETK